MSTNIITALTESQWFASIMDYLAALGVPIISWVGKRHPGLAFAKYIARAMAARDTSDAELEASLFLQTAVGLGLIKFARSQYQLEPFPAQTQLARFTLTSAAGSPDTSAAAGDVTVGQVGSALEWVNVEPFSLPGGGKAVVLFAATGAGPEWNITANAQLELRTTILGASVANPPVGQATALGSGSSGLLLFAQRAGVTVVVVNNGANQTLSVGEDLMTGVVTVSAGTDGGGVIISTADQVRLILAQVPDLVAYAKNATTGSGLIATGSVALSWTGSYIQVAGAAEETPESVKERCFGRFMALGGWAGDGAPPAAVATDEGLEYWARQPPAGRTTSPVVGVKVLSNWLNGVVSGNDITVIIWGALGALSTQDVTAVDGNFYNGRKFSLGADLHTRTVTNVPVVLTGTVAVFIDFGYTQAEVMALINARVAIYQQNTKAVFPGCTLRREVLSAKIGDALPDEALSNVTLSMPVDTTYTFLQYPQLDTSGLTVIFV